MNDIFTVKNVLSILAGAGVGQVIDDAIDATAPVEAKLPVKILRKIGSFTLGWMISTWAGKYVEELYDTAAELVEKAKTAVDETEETEDADSAPHSGRFPWGSENAFDENTITVEEAM